MKHLNTRDFPKKIAFSLKNSRLIRLDIAAILAVAFLFLPFFNAKAQLFPNPSPNARTDRFKVKYNPNNTGTSGFAELAGQNQTSVTRTGQTFGTYTYRAVAWNHSRESESAAKSADITVTVNNPCIFVSAVAVIGSVSRTVEAGASFTMEMTVAGASTYTVKWYCREGSGNFAKLAGQNQTSVTRTEQTSGTYAYRAVAWNRACESESAAKSIDITATVSNPCQPVAGVTPTSACLPDEKAGVPFTPAARVTGSADCIVRWERSADNGNSSQPIPGAAAIVCSRVEQTAGAYLCRAVVAARCGGGEAASASMVVVVGSACEAVAAPALFGSSTLPNEKANVAFLLQASVYGGNSDYSVQWTRAKVSGDNRCPGSPGAGAASFADISGAASLVFLRSETAQGVYKYKFGCLIAGSIIPFDDFRTFAFAALARATYMAACADPSALTCRDGTAGWRPPNIAELGKLYMVDKNSQKNVVKQII
jgi:hypothetical protein